jgi:hypothetical protein
LLTINNPPIESTLYHRVLILSSIQSQIKTNNLGQFERDKGLRKLIRFAEFDAILENFRNLENRRWMLHGNFQLQLHLTREDTVHFAMGLDHN